MEHFGLGLACNNPWVTTEEAGREMDHHLQYENVWRVAAVKGVVDDARWSQRCVNKASGPNGC